MTTEIITAIVPFRNASKYLPRAFRGLDSISVPHLEVVCVDDGSFDDSFELAQTWAQTTHHTVKLLQLDEPGGVAKARNLAVNEASGEFLWFLDSDDEWAPDVVSHLLDGVTDDNVDIVLCNAERVIQATGHRTVIEDAPARIQTDGRTALNMLLSGKVQGHLWNKLIRRSLAVRCPFPPLETVSDLGGFARMLTHARSISFNPGVKYFYLVRSDSLFQSNKRRWRNLQEVSEIIERLVDEGAGDNKSGHLLRLFRYSTIMMPSLNAMATQGYIEKQEVPYLNNLRVKDIINLIKLGSPKLAIQCALAAWCLPLYVHLYKKYARKKWGANA